MSDVEKTSRPYYDNADKLSFDKAWRLVVSYLNDGTPRDVTRVKHILEQSPYSYTDHNHARVLAVLQEICEPHETAKSGANRFKIPDEYR